MLRRLAWRAVGILGWLHEWSGEAHEVVLGYLTGTRQEEDALIKKWIANHAGDGPEEAYIRDHGARVWALMNHWHLVGSQTQTADDYGIPQEAMEAALRHWRRHRTRFYARDALNKGG